MSVNTQLYERVSVLEANYGSMNKSIDSLNNSITTLNDKLDVFASKFSVSAGIFIAIVFLCQAIVVPLIIAYVTKH